MYETRLEDEANDKMAQAGTIGSEAAINAARAILKHAETQWCRKDLRARVEQLCQALFDSIKLQTSVKRFHASESERGCVLDFLDYPLNNRWWLEDEFDAIRKMPTETEKVARLAVLAHWEHPGPGSYYDDIGDLAKSPHLVRGPELNTDPLIPLRGTSFPGFVWDQGGNSRLRLSWQGSMRPGQMVYENLDPKGNYTVRINGRGNMDLYVNQKKLERVGGQPDAKPEDTKAPQGTRPRYAPEFTNFEIPQELLKDRRAVLDWGNPNEIRTNVMRFGASVTEVWLLKKK
jgi:hypothetical protein